MKFSKWIYIIEFFQDSTKLDLTIIKEELRHAGWCCRYHHGSCWSRVPATQSVWLKEVWRKSKTKKTPVSSLILYYTELSLSPHHLSIIDLIWSINTSLLCRECSGYFLILSRNINHEASVFGLFYWLCCIWEIKLFYWSCCDDLHSF